MPSSPLLFFEIPNQKTETQVLLNLFPDRIGHGTFLSSSKEGSPDLVDFVRQHQIPLGKASGPPGNSLTLPPLPAACHPYVEKHCSKYIDII